VKNLRNIRQCIEFGRILWDSPNNMVGVVLVHTIRIKASGGLL